MSPHLTTGNAEHLADTLWSVRHVVQFLLYKLTVAKLLLAADERRFVGFALQEVERVVEALRDAELRRSIALEALAADWHVPADDLSLGALVDRVPEPLRPVFADHQQAFAELAAEIDQTTKANRQLASAGLAQLRQTIDALHGLAASDSTYDARGRIGGVPTAPFHLDEAL